MALPAGFQLEEQQTNLPAGFQLEKPELKPDSLGRFVANGQPQPATPTGPIQVGEEAPNFTRGVGNILPQLQNVYGGAKVLAGKALGSEEMMQSGMEHMKAGEAKTSVKESDDLYKAWDKGIGTVITDWLPYQVGAGVGSMLGYTSGSKISSSINK